MYVTDGSLPQNNQMPPDPANAARCRAKMMRLGTAVTNAKAMTGQLAPPASFVGISGPTLVSGVVRGQDRLRIGGTFLGQPLSAPGTVTGAGSVNVKTPNNPKPGVQIVPFMDVGLTTIAKPLCPPPGSGVAIAGPTWGDAILPGSNCPSGAAGMLQWVQSNPWLALGVAIAGGFALSSMVRK